MNKILRFFAAIGFAVFFTSALGAATRIWIGGSGALASTDANWDSGSAPVTGDDVVFDATGRDYPCTWDLDIAPASWTQDGYTNVVTIQTVYDASGFDCLEVAGDIVFNSGIWTHKNNTGSSRTYRLYVSCGGDMTIGTQAKINVTGLGYRYKIAVNGHSDSGTQGGTHGGHGGMATAQETWTHGSLFAPEEPGNAGNAPSGSDCSGGGAVRLDVGGAFTHNGAIVANGVAVNYSYYGGAGGSVFVKAGSMSGTGTIDANSPNVQISGGGGRVALILSDAGAGFSGYNVTSLVSCVSLRKDADTGGSGTIYAETAADGANHGWLVLKGNGTEPTKRKIYYADPFSYECPSANFSKITIIRKTKLILNPGCTLDVTGTQFELDSMSYGLVMNGGEVVTRGGAGFNVPFRIETVQAATLDIGSLTLQGTGLIISDNPVSIAGSLTMEAGSQITTVTGASQVPSHRLSLSVGGDMTIAAGATVSMAGKGYAKGYANGGQIPANKNAGSHGGWGLAHNSTPTLSSVAPYGSALNPLTPGSSGGVGSNTSAGGGVAVLSVGGTLTVNGTITADGDTASWYPSAGGSVNITAGALDGAATGVISANGGRCSNDSYASGGGGRIAIRLTGANADFSSYLGSITAYGLGYMSSANRRRGGAGTVYLQTAAQGEGGGRLVIDNGTAATSAKTVIGGDCDGTTFGDVSIAANGVAELAAGATLTLSGSVLNTGSFSAGAGSTVVFSGMAAASVSGNNTFANLSCTVGGKTLSFAAGSTTTLTGVLSLSGDSGSPLSLVSSAQGEAWTLDTSAADAVISATAIRDCTSISEITAVNSQDLGNNVNIVFQTIVPSTATWTGAAGTAWANADNWDVGRVPLAFDTAVISATANSPILGTDVKIESLTIQNGATLDIADKTLEITGNLTALGAVASSQAGQIVIAGSAAQTVSATSLSAGTLRLLGSAMTLSGAYSCPSIIIGDGATSIDCAFASGASITATYFVVSGDTATPSVTLRPAVSGGSWSLSTCSQSVSGATVSGSDASGGVAIVPVACADAGGNVNWLFTDSRLRWTGANGTDFADGGNWAGGTAPASSDAVVIEGDFAVSVDAAASVAALTVGGGAMLTANAALAVSGSLLVEDGGTLVLNKPATVGGSFVMLDGASMTHDVNKGAETNKIDLDVAGTGYIAPGAKIDVKAKGYYAVNNVSTYNRGPGLGTKSNMNNGASHGGLGYHQNVRTAVPCYGSIVNPVTIGSGGGYGGNGGGAVILRFGGALVLEGEIDADAENSSQSYYCGSGGSVNIRAASLTGSGSAHAGGGASACQLPGGGGRTAVTLTAPGASFSAFTGTLSAYGGYTGIKIASSAGTVYLKAAGDAHGTVRISNDPVSALNSSDVFAAQDGTDFPKTKDNDPAEVRLVNVAVGRYATLNLTADAKVSDITTLSSSAIKLNGYKLKVAARQHPLPGTITYGTNAGGNPGEIIWGTPATVIMLR